MFSSENVSVCASFETAILNPIWFCEKPRKYNDNTIMCTCIHSRVIVGIIEGHIIP